MSTEAVTADQANDDDGHGILNNPAYASLTGPHAGLAERRGRILRYRPDISPWLGVPSDLQPSDWDDLAGFANPQGLVPIPGVAAALPDGWSYEQEIPGVQLVDEGLRAAPDPEAIILTAADVPEMLDLVARAQPGPFLPHTIDMGIYRGLRHSDGRLIAMAGERLHPPGYTEISAVCTDADFRGQGLATRLIRAVAFGIRERGETPFLHTSATNDTAIRLYENLGFRLRRRTTFGLVRVPR